MSAAKALPRITQVTRPYWDGARSGKLMLQRCQTCRAVIHYPRPWCPACWSTELEWFEASGHARVITYTVVHQPPFEAYALDVPYVLAVARLEEGPQMMANVLGIDSKRMRIDLPVRVIFEARAGGVCVPQFEPAEQ